MRSKQASRRGPAASPGPRDREGAAPADRPQLLIVEDEPDLRRYLARCSSGTDTTCSPCRMPKRTAALEDENEPAEPQLILLDVTLPGKSGLELLVLLRQRPRTARVPVIVLTGRSGSENAVEALLAGADDYVVKPFDSAELLARSRPTGTCRSFVRSPSTRPRPSRASCGRPLPATARSGRRSASSSPATGSPPIARSTPSYGSASRAIASCATWRRRSSPPAPSPMAPSDAAQDAPLRSGSLRAG